MLIPREMVAALLVVIGGILLLLWTVVGPYLEKKHMTKARRAEIAAWRAKKGQRHVWNIIAPILIIGLPVLFIVDGLVFRIGLLYSPYLSFFNPFDTHVQAAGVVLASIGLLIMVVVGRTLILEVFSKASEERRMISTGIYAYVRHPFYLSFLLISIGMFLITLNVVGLLLLPPLLIFTNSDLEVCGREGKMTFIFKAMECEEMAMVQRYGRDYEDYMQRTGRLFPRLRRS